MTTGPMRLEGMLEGWITAQEIRDSAMRFLSFHRSANWLGWIEPCVFSLAFVIGVSALHMHAQKGPGGGTPSPPPGPYNNTPLPSRPVFVDSKAPDYGPPPEHTPTFQEQQYLRYLNSRLKSMVSDTDKLLELAQRLNQETDLSNHGSSSSEDIRTVAEIEKLARSVKWKMQLVADASQAH